MNTEIEQLKNVVTHSMDQINKSIVPEEVDKNDLHCTTDVDEWLETIKQSEIFGKDPSQTNYFHFNFDYEIIKNASGYITAPAFTYKTKVELAGSNAFYSLKELKDFLLNKKYLLYMIVVSVKTDDVDKEDPFKLKPLDKPIIVYTFRGHILE
jgi:hypothetical protein